jgi:hypothetical protein
MPKPPSCSCLRRSRASVTISVWLRPWKCIAYRAQSRDLLVFALRLKMLTVLRGAIDVNSYITKKEKERKDSIGLVRLAYLRCVLQIDQP